MTNSKVTPICDIDDMIGLFGLKPFDDIDIVFTGMRPGEKLFEELNTEGENITKTKHPKIFIGTINTYDDRMVVGALAMMKKETDDLSALTNEVCGLLANSGRIS